jgi:hypothetical protein
MLNPPRPQVPSRWRTTIFKGSVALAHELRTIAVISVILFTLYLQIVATTSKNWDTTRLMGFVQPRVCTATQNAYGVSDYLLINSTKPICYKNNDPSAICFTQSFFLESEEFLNNLEIGEDNTLTSFAALFTRATRNYFPLATFTTVIAFISLLLTALYETKDAQHFVRGEDGAFFANTRFEKRIIIRINYLLCVALIIMLIIATTFEIYLYQEICPEVYKYQDIDPSFCTSIEAAGIMVASVIAPTDMFARNYKALNIVLAVGLAVGVICRCLTDDYQQDNAQLRILPTNAGNNENGDRNILDALAENWREIRLELARVRDDNGVQRYALRERVVRNRRANWKKLPEEEIPSEAECSICLAAVLKRASSGIALVPTIATGTANYSIISADEENPNPPNAQNSTLAEPSISRQTASTVRAQCGHIFHENCIQEWFQNHNTCPVCRNSLQALEEEEER